MPISFQVITRRWKISTNVQVSSPQPQRSRAVLTGNFIPEMLSLKRSNVRTSQRIFGKDCSPCRNLR
ncbi:unknown protein [Microcystis aeruginosa NIES-843]|uniref:Uncharacterized protein n=1 Tax=Microcystis aeruginosa (strain NIES-843 / IAM M-2473) TaxID=449447 RepID=B0JLI7_MICAN|nr:unknown protein [Microcystis aeruginosa NIES-843]